MKLSKNNSFIDEKETTQEKNDEDCEEEDIIKNQDF